MSAPAQQQSQDTKGRSERLYLNRELSWLDFNARVLQEAIDPRTPLLERVKFLAIFSSNLDEFFMVRVAGIKRQLAAGVSATSPDGLTPRQQLDAITKKIAPLVDAQQQCLATLLGRLGDHDILLVDIDSLSGAEFSALDDYFEREVFPVLTPLALDPGHPFPYISNLTLSLAVRLRDPDDGTIHLARVKVPKSLPRWVPVSGRPTHFVPLEQVIGANLGALFPGFEVDNYHAFRLTRYSDLEIPDAEEPEDLLAMIEEQVFQRRFGEVVRIEVETGMPQDMRELLLDELRHEGAGTVPLTDADIVDAGPLLDLGDLQTIAALTISTAPKAAPFQPAVPMELRDPDRSIFEVIREGDVLLHHPFDSFGASVERFIEEAAVDDNVLAIKMTLYRTSGDTAVVDSLIRAAQHGKQVAVLVELKARFDEANNISWARTLEDYGIHVAYGSATIKIHAKTALVVRREADGVRRYVHLGSGNYNSRTARLYTDVGLLTCSPSIGADVSDLFNSLTGYSRQRIYRKLLVAPHDLRSRFIELVEREAQHAVAGKPARIIAKMNALVDVSMIDTLYAASKRGVQIDLLVRGICCLRPQVPGLSENIRVVSIIGRFLEHSRIFYFANGGDAEYYIGSADWMPRNFDRRIEAVAPVEKPAHHERLRALLELYLEDNRQGWDLGADGRWRQREPGDFITASHELLLVNSWGIIEGATGPNLFDENGGTPARPKGIVDLTPRSERREPKSERREPKSERREAKPKPA
ncbi:MAG TPA: polyphosphate kinase 1 [Gemmatimonadaceae bacterium]|nr:polyphosphate kinase 1 [Gemmatimonadaceae bacterium]